jgi:hypothetical protein
LIKDVDPDLQKENKIGNEKSPVKKTRPKFSINDQHLFGS